MTSIDDQLTERANPWVKAVLWCVDDDRMSVVLQFNPASVTLGRSPGFSSEARMQGASKKKGSGDPTPRLQFDIDRIDKDSDWDFIPTRARANAILPDVVESDVGFGRTPGNYGKLSSSGGHNDSLSMSVVFDTTESDSALKGLGVNPFFPDMLPAYSKSVLEDVEKLYNLTKPILAPDLGLGKKRVERPPIVVFLWDKLRFSGAITAFSVGVSAFDKVGVARRATVELGLSGRAYMQATSGKEVTDDVSPVKSVGFALNTLETSSVMPSMLPVRRIRFT
jgi:hypothetical protein